MGKSGPANDHLAGVSSPKASYPRIFEKLYKRPMSGERHSTTYGYDCWQILRDERRLFPFARTKFQGSVDEDKIDEYPGKESDCFHQTWRVEDTVDELPGQIRTPVEQIRCENGCSCLFVLTVGG